MAEKSEASCAKFGKLKTKDRHRKLERNLKLACHKSGIKIGGQDLKRITRQLPVQLSQSVLSIDSVEPNDSESQVEEYADSTSKETSTVSTGQENMGRASARSKVTEPSGKSKNKGQTFPTVDGELSSVKRSNELERKDLSVISSRSSSIASAFSVGSSTMDQQLGHLIFHDKKGSENYDDSRKEEVWTKRLFDWSLTLAEPGKLIISGCLASGKYISTKPAIRRHSAKSIETADRCICHLEGNITGTGHELPDYIRNKFYHGFPIDWLNVCQVWRLYVLKGSPKEFCWSTAIAGANRDYESAKRITDFSGDCRAVACFDAGSDQAKKRFSSMPDSRKRISDETCRRKTDSNETQPETENFPVGDPSLGQPWPVEESSGVKSLPSIPSIAPQRFGQRPDPDSVENRGAYLNSISMEIDTLYNNFISIFHRLRQSVVVTASYALDSSQRDESKGSQLWQEKLSKEQKSVSREGDSSDMVIRRVSGEATFTRTAASKLADCISEASGGTDTESGERQGNRTASRTVASRESERFVCDGNFEDSESEVYAGVRKIPAKTLLLRRKPNLRTQQRMSRRTERKARRTTPETCTAREERNDDCVASHRRGADLKRTCISSGIRSPEYLVSEDISSCGSDTDQMDSPLVRQKAKRKSRCESRVPGEAERTATRTATATNEVENQPPKWGESAAGVSRSSALRHAPGRRSLPYRDRQFSRNAAAEENRSILDSMNRVDQYQKRRIPLDSDSTELEDRSQISKARMKKDISLPDEEGDSSTAEAKAYSSGKIRSSARNFAKKAVLAEDNRITEEAFANKVSGYREKNSGIHRIDAGDDCEERGRKEHKNRKRKRKKTENPESVGESDLVEVSRGNDFDIVEGMDDGCKSVVKRERLWGNDESAEWPKRRFLVDWMPRVIRNCGAAVGAGGLVFEGRIFKNRNDPSDGTIRRTGIVHRRISARLIETVDSNVYELVGGMSDPKNRVPKELVSHCRDGCPSRIEKFCEVWLKLTQSSVQDARHKEEEAARGSPPPPPPPPPPLPLPPPPVRRTLTGMPGLPVSSKGRKRLPALNYWFGERAVMKDDNLVYNVDNVYIGSPVSSDLDTVGTQSGRRNHGTVANSIDRTDVGTRMVRNDETPPSHRRGSAKRPPGTRRSSGSQGEDFPTPSNNKRRRMNSALENQDAETSKTQQDAALKGAAAECKHSHGRHVDGVTYRFYADPCTEGDALSDDECTHV